MEKRLKNIFLLVKALHQGKITSKQIPRKCLNEVIDIFKEIKNKKLIVENININNDNTAGENIVVKEDDINNGAEQNPIAKTFSQKGNFDQYIDRFDGLEFKPKELESITNYTEIKPINSILPNQKTFFIKYENTDNFNNSTITVIKKLREENNLVFTVFQNNKSQQPTDNAGGNVQEDNIVVKKSIPFQTEIEGGEILANILPKLEI